MGLGRRAARPCGLQEVLHHKNEFRTQHAWYRTLVEEASRLVAVRRKKRETQADAKRVSEQIVEATKKCGVFGCLVQVVDAFGTGRQISLAKPPSHDRGIFDNQYNRIISIPQRSPFWPILQLGRVLSGGSSRPDPNRGRFVGISVGTHQC